MQRRDRDTPWSLKGVRPEVREMAKAAAAESGQTVGAWLSAAIRMVGEAELRSAANQDIATGDPDLEARPQLDRAAARDGGD